MILSMLKGFEETKKPQRSTNDSAGYDVFSGEDYVLKSKEVTTVTIPCTVDFNPLNYKVVLVLRSSFGNKKHIRLYDENSEAIIPAVELMNNESVRVNLLNVGDEDVLLEKGMHFVQLLVMKRECESLPFDLEAVQDVKDTTPLSFEIGDYPGSKNQEKVLFLKEPLTLGVGESFLVPTGLKARIDAQTVLLGTVPGEEKRFGLANSVAVIDADYYNNPGNEGHIFFKVENRTLRHITLPVGTTLVELITTPFYKIENEVSPEQEREGGIGSTSGKNK